MRIEVKTVWGNREDMLSVRDLQVIRAIHAGEGMTIYSIPKDIEFYVPHRDLEAAMDRLNATPNVKTYGYEEYRLVSFRIPSEQKVSA